MTDNLPKGLLPVPSFPARGAYGRGPAPPLKMSCSAVGRKVTCTGGPEGPVGPGESVSVIVPVRVEAGASGVLANTVAVEGGGAAKIESSTPTPISASPSPFAFLEGPGLYGSATNADGSEATLAASHPYQLTVAGMNLTMNQSGPNLRGAGGGLKEATVELPAGTVVDPQAAARCKESDLEKATIGCPAASQVGTVALTLSVAEDLGEGAPLIPLYNMVAPSGSPAELGFEVIGGSYVHLLGAVRSDGSFTLTASGKDVLARVPVMGVRATLWGEPSAASHDNQRGDCLVSPALPACTTERTRQAFVTMPAACGPAPATIAHIAGWLGETDEASYGAPRAIEGCESVGFEPSITARPTTTTSDSPSGLEFDLRQAQSTEYENEAGEPVRGKAPLKDATVTLPAGVTLNPAAANGREACTPDQIGLISAPGVTPVRYREEPAHCPPASKVGTASVSTPLLDHELAGSVYLAKPFANPAGTLLAIYLVIEDEASGIIAKLAGRVQSDATTGQLTTTFTENPQLPLGVVHLSLFEGARAALTTPLTCGTKTTLGQLTPWSTPTPTTVADSFEITQAPGGGACPASEAQAPAAPSLSAGTTNPQAGAYSPFVLKLTRADGTQRISAIDTTLPLGLTGKLAGIPYCTEAQIAAARAAQPSRRRKARDRKPLLPGGLGARHGHRRRRRGPEPLLRHRPRLPRRPIQRRPALDGDHHPGGRRALRPRRGGGPGGPARRTSKPPRSTRSPTRCRRSSTASLSTCARSTLELGRPGFTLNPTSCDPPGDRGDRDLTGGHRGEGLRALPGRRLQGAEVQAEAEAQPEGPTKRAGHPALRAEITYPKGPGYANIASAQVGLPASEFLDQGNLNKVCTQPQLKSASCPKSSVYGSVKAWTPLLDKPLTGPSTSAWASATSCPPWSPN